jgi:hypothetical protein
MCGVSQQDDRRTHASRSTPTLSRGEDSEDARLGAAAGEDTRGPSGCLHEIEPPPHEVVLNAGDAREGGGIQRIDLSESTECRQARRHGLRDTRVIDVGEHATAVDGRVLPADIR